MDNQSPSENNIIYKLNDFQQNEIDSGEDYGDEEELGPSNNLNNIDDLAGMSAMEGINRLETLMTEVNLTVCKIQ